MSKWIELEGTKEEAEKYCKIGEGVDCQIRVISGDEWLDDILINIIPSADHPFQCVDSSPLECRIRIPEGPKDKWLRAVWAKHKDGSMHYLITGVSSDDDKFIYISCSWVGINYLELHWVPLDANKEEIK